MKKKPNKIILETWHTKIDLLIEPYDNSELEEWVDCFTRGMISLSYTDESIFNVMEAYIKFKRLQKTNGKV